ncbi:transposase [Streptomyces sp. NPDC040750]|uniref:transposase n=1 Tax=Streptomyces sp. NPDC040750 TaxID=3154491 RepID=UPI003410CC1D
MYRAAEPEPVIRRLAEDLGVHHGALRNWIRQAETDAMLTCSPPTRRKSSPSCDARCGNCVGRTRSCGRPRLVRRTARPDPAQVTALLDEHPHLGVEPVLRELHIPSFTYYRWHQTEKEPCERIRQDTELTGQIPADPPGLRRQLWPAADPPGCFDRVRSAVAVPVSCCERPERSASRARAPASVAMRVVLLSW